MSALSERRGALARILSWFGRLVAPSTSRTPLVRHRPAEHEISVTIVARTHSERAPTPAFLVAETIEAAGAVLAGEPEPATPARSGATRANRMLAARMACVSRLNPPAARAVLRGKRAAPKDKHIPKKAAVEPKRQARVNGAAAIRRGNRPVNLAPQAYGNVIDLAQARRTRRHRPETRAA